MFEFERVCFVVCAFNEKLNAIELFLIWNSKLMNRQW